MDAILAGITARFATPRVPAPRAVQPPKLLSPSARRDDPLEDDEEQHERADEDAGPPGVEVAVELLVGVDGAEGEDPEHRAEDVAGATREQRAADHHGGDRIELVADAGHGVSGGGVEGE